jgi:DNA-binding CsgD family transcriptional regulator
MPNEADPVDQSVAQLSFADDAAPRAALSSMQRMADALSVAGHPVALLGRDGSVIHMNARFQRLVGGGLLVRSGRLCSWHADADDALGAAIERALSCPGQPPEALTSVVLPRPGGQRPLVAKIVSVARPSPDFRPPVDAIVTLTDLEPAGTGPTEAVLEQAFTLTRAEARLASQIASGKTLANIAADDGSARETLRSRLKSIFEKTGTRRQAELTLLLSKIELP